MRFKTLVALFGALLLALVTSAGTAFAQTPDPYAPPNSSDTGFVSASSIAQGETVVFGGEGFESGTEVDIAVDGEVLGSVEAEDGEFAVELEFEGCGEFILSGSGTGSEGEFRTVTASVEVVCDDDDDKGGSGGGSGSGGGATIGNGSTGNGSTGTGSGSGSGSTSTGSTGSQLPRTGSDVTTTALVSGLVLITVGALFVFGARNRARRIV